MARFMRTDLGHAHSQLLPPAVVGAGIYFRGPGTRIADPYSGSAQRRAAHSDLRAPVVVNPFVPPANPKPIDVMLANQEPQQRDTRRGPLSKLFAPVVVRIDAFYGPRVQDVSVPVNFESPARRAHASLRPPTVVNAAASFGGSSVQLAYSRRGAPRSTLHTPAVVGAGVAFYGPAVHVTRGRAGRPQSELRAPAVVGAGIVFAPVAVTLTYSRRGQPRPSLHPPAAVGSGVVFYPVATALAYSRRGAPKPVLRPPVVVGAGVVFRQVDVELAYSRRGVPRSELRPPAVVAPPPIPAPVKATVTRGRAGHARSLLIPPAAVGAGIAFGGPGTVLAYQSRGRTSSVLTPPAVVTPFTPTFVPPIRVVLVRGRAGRAAARFVEPAVVGAGVAFGGPGTVLAASRRSVARSTLHAPAVVAVVVAAPVYPVRVTLARTRGGVPRSRLFPPVIPPLAEPTRVTAAPSKRPTAKPHLAPPAVVGAGTVFSPVAATLVSARPVVVTAALSAPAVVQVVVVAYYGPSVALASSARGRARSLFVEATVVGAGIVFRPVDVTLAKPPPARRNTSRLAPARVVAAPTAPPVSDIRVSFTARRRDIATFAFVMPPSIVATPVPFLPALEVKLAASKRGRPSSELRPPTVVGTFVSNVWWRGPGVRLANIEPRQGRPARSELRAPTVVQPVVVVYFGPAVNLAASRRGAPKSDLRAPAVVGAGIVFAPVTVTLAPSSDIPLRRRPDSKLRPPTVVQPVTVVFFGPAVHLTRGRAGRPVSDLHAPAVVGAGIVFRQVDVTLTRARPVRTRTVLFAPVIPPVAEPTRVTLARIKPVDVTARLAPPAVVQALVVVYYGPNVTLAASRRGEPFSILRRPAAVGAGVVFRRVAVKLAPSTDVPLRRRAEHILRPPAVVSQPPAFLPSEIVQLSPQRRGVAKSDLHPPASVGSGIAFGGPGTIFTRGRAGHARGFLRPPTVVNQPPPPVVSTLAVHGTYSVRGRTASVLHQPVLEFPNLTTTFGPLVQLAPIPRRKTTARLKPPTVVSPGKLFRPVKVTLVRIKVPPTVAFVAPPNVVGPGIVFRPVKVSVADIRRLSIRPKTRSRLEPPTVVITKLEGFSCGYDIATALSSGGDTSDISQGGDQPTDFTSGDDQHPAAPLP